METQATGGHFPTSVKSQNQNTNMLYDKASPKQSVMDRFNSYTAFTPGTSTTSATEGVCSSVSNFFSKLHNISARRENPFDEGKVLCLAPIGDVVQYILPKSVGKFFKHQGNITLDPIGYAKGEGGHSLKRRAFDLLIGGSLAAIAETIVSASLLVLSGLLIIGGAIYGVVQKAKGEDEAMMPSVVGLVGMIYSMTTTVKSIARIAPLGIGQFLGYGVSLGTAAVEMGIDKIAAKIENYQAGKKTGLHAAKY